MVEGTVAVRSTGYQPGCTTGLTTVLNEQSVRSTRLSNRIDNRLYRVNGVLD